MLGKSAVKQVPLDYLSLLLCLGIALSLVIFFVVWATPLITLRADILMWEETDFVGNILKLRLGVPFYTSPADNNSMVYTPASPILTYAISWLFGQSASIPAYRWIQLGYTILAAAFATDSVRRLWRLASPEQKISRPVTWMVLTSLSMFLAATEPETNRFTFALHVDALALLVSILCFWAMVRYAAASSRGRLFFMTVCPTLAYLTKQYLVVWAAVMFVFLVIAHPRSYRRLSFFAGASAGFVLLAITGCYLLWGENYLFWTWEVMGGTRSRIVFSPHSHSLSLARSLDHLLRVWPPLALGVVGLWLLFRQPCAHLRWLVGLCVAWVLIVLSQSLSSGTNWDTLYHFGPGVVIGMIWLFAALPGAWAAYFTESSTGVAFPHLRQWAKPFMAVLFVSTTYMVLNAVPTGDRSERRNWQSICHPVRDVNRYIAEIEREFEGLPPEDVLLDMGNWIYLPHGVLQKDRSVSLADQPVRGLYDNFEPMKERLRQHAYAKVLVRDFHSPFFLLDWGTWSRPSGIRQTLKDYYREVRLIRAPESSPLVPFQITVTGPVSVFVPKDATGASEADGVDEGRAPSQTSAGLP